MLVFKNIDELFETQFPDHGKGGSSWLAANHACVCNLDGDSWAPNDWNKDNCAFTGMTHPEALTEPPPVTQQGTHSLLNSGLFLFEPSKELWRGILEFLNSSPLLKDFLFPDQDFLAEYFRGRWISVGWQYNALKTWRYWHPNIWKDEEVRNLHYIVDKPWNKRAGNDGYLGNDDQTHRWWWVEYENWELNRQAEGEKEILAMVRAHIARPIEES
jgi:inositol 3-alpha-galactosyltransferase